MRTLSIPASSPREGVARSPTLLRYTPEFRLVLLCLCWPLRPHDLPAIADAAEAVHDWQHVLRVASRHRVVGLVARALQRAGYRLPSLPAAELQRMSATAARQALLLSVESLRLRRLLSEHSIDALFLKGAAVAVLAYGDVSVRHAKDIDLLVPEKGAKRAMQALHHAGYLPAFDLGAVPENRQDLWFHYAKSMDWIHSVSGIQLELHWRLTDLPVLGSSFPTGARQQVTVTAGHTLETLECDRLLTYLCVHGAAHGWMRLKWLADVYALLPHDADGCEQTYRRLLNLGGGRAAGQALLLCHDLLQLPLPVSLLREIQKDATVQFLRRSALHLLTRGGEVAEVDDLPFGTTSVYLSRLLLGSGAASFITELKLWAYRPDELLRTRLPQALLFLFPLVRLGSWLRGRVRHGGRSPHTR